MLLLLLMLILPLLEQFSVKPAELMPAGNPGQRWASFPPRAAGNGSPRLFCSFVVLPSIAESVSRLRLCLKDAGNLPETLISVNLQFGSFATSAATAARWIEAYVDILVIFRFESSFFAKQNTRLVESSPHLRCRYGAFDRV